MKAMVLAAGLGTRLRPLTDSRPKALVQIGGRTLLEITLTRLRDYGIRDVIINTHHFAEMIRQYLAEKSNFGMHLELSHEDVLLDTGGGLKKAAHFFQQDDQTEPFVLHNVDIISTIDIGRMVEFHRRRNALATLAVQDRTTSRYLLFDENLQLSGRQTGTDGTPELVRNAQPLQPLAFSGIHVISPDFLSMMTEQRAFSIITSYLRIAGEGKSILGFRADEYSWRDMGKVENIKAASEAKGDFA